MNKIKLFGLAVLIILFSSSSAWAVEECHSQIVSDHGYESCEKLVVDSFEDCLDYFAIGVTRTMSNCVPDKSSDTPSCKTSIRKCTYRPL